MWPRPQGHYFAVNETRLDRAPGTDIEQQYCSPFGPDHADSETKRTAALYPRADQRDWRLAILRRNEGGARSGVEIRHSPPHHGARGARLSAPLAPPGAGAGSAEDAG